MIPLRPARTGRWILRRRMPGPPAVLVLVLVLAAAGLLLEVALTIP